MKCQLPAFAWLLASVALAGCTPTLPELQFVCEDTSQCPPGLVCSDTHRCSRTLTHVSASAGASAVQEQPGVTPAADGGGAGSSVGGAAGSSGATASARAGTGAVAAGSAAAGMTASRPSSAGVGGAVVAGAGALAGQAGNDAKPICMANQRRCDGDTLRTCAANGQSEHAEGCAYGCSPQRLACNACAPSAAPTCTGESLRVCSADGARLETTECANGCSSQRPECLTCTSSQRVCKGQCVALDDSNNCGADCMPCPAVTNGKATCAANSCGFSCDAGAVRCNGGSNCEKLSWDFETSLDEWHGVTATGGGMLENQVDDSAPTISSERAHGGTSALRSPITVTSTRFSYQVFKFMCGQGSLDLTGKTIRAWVYLKASSSSGTNTCSVYGHDGMTNFGEGSVVNIPLNSWTQISSSRISGTGAHANTLGFDCRLGDGGSTSWSGTIYIDDISVQ